jgi:hypothetical protein
MPTKVWAAVIEEVRLSKAMLDIDLAFSFYPTENPAHRRLPAAGATQRNVQPAPSN